MKDLIWLISTDIYRHEGKYGFKDFKKCLLTSRGFRLSLAFRLAKYFKERNSVLAFFFKRFHSYVCSKYCVDMPLACTIGMGIHISHCWALVISSNAKIGNNVNISHGVTIAKGNRGKNKGYPTIGNNVYIGPGAKIIGNVQVGNNVAIGANCVVTKDIPDNAVVIGVPGKIISYNGALGYVNNTDY